MGVVDPLVIRVAAEAGADIYPYAEYRPIPEASTQPTIVPWLFMLHTMAGPRSTAPDALWAFINRADITGESHLILGYAALIQALPFTVRADNNHRANSWMAGVELVGAVSVETQDNGAESDPGIAKAPWNEYQLEHLAGIAAFLNLRYQIPLQRCLNWDSRGIDGHRAHPEWSKYVGKTCPGQTRWEQIPSIIAAAEQIVAHQPAEEPMIAIRPAHPDLGGGRFLFTTEGQPISSDLARHLGDQLVVVDQSHRHWDEATLHKMGEAARRLYRSA